MLKPILCFVSYPTITLLKKCPNFIGVDNVKIACVEKLDTF
jgi:hypothetical protein